MTIAAILHVLHIWCILDQNIKVNEFKFPITIDIVIIKCKSEPAN